MDKFSLWYLYKQIITQINSQIKLQEIHPFKMSHPLGTNG